MIYILEFYESYHPMEKGQEVYTDAFSSLENAITIASEYIIEEEGEAYLKKTAMIYKTKPTRDENGSIISEKESLVREYSLTIEQ